MPEPLDPATYRDLIRAALAEDVGSGDITTIATVPESTMARGVFIAKSPTVVAGIQVAADVFTAVMSGYPPSTVADDVTPTIGGGEGFSSSGFAVMYGYELEFAVRDDGESYVAGQQIAEVTGPARLLLTAERTALNFLQYMSGIATLTRQYVDAAQGRVTILDTRKTTPGLRALAKYAVRCGGGGGYRAGLYDAFMIKDNHIRVAGGIAAAVAKARASAPGKTIEVEAQTLAEVDEAIQARADIIMLDNFTDDDTRTAIARIDRRAKVELSGNMTLDRVRHLSTFGADSISVGALTHSAPAADISLEIDLGLRRSALGLQSD